MGAIILRTIGGLVMAGVGVLLVLKSEWFYENFGAIEWAEQNLGSSGGSRLFYKLIGIGVIFIGFIVATGMFGGFIQGTLVKWLVPQPQ
ncbi:MAG: hypothetical protein PHT12_04090 [Patescibacteria group bacterium]|nr:hypothetical protein [Patescibacteria group bacterium]